MITAEILKMYTEILDKTYNGEAINVKHQKKYKVLGIALDCTNSTDDRAMVIYKDNSLTFVREFNEFLKKFDPTK